jgi:glutamate-5-semialdehyde dehydrogenase
MSTATIPVAKSALTTHEIALAAKHASRLLAPLDEAARNAALEAMAKALEAASADLMAANAKTCTRRRPPVVTRSCRLRRWLG